MIRDSQGCTIALFRKLLDQLVLDSQYEHARANNESNEISAANHIGRSLGISHATVRLNDLLEKEFGNDYAKHPAWTGESML